MKELRTIVFVLLLAFASCNKDGIVDEVDDPPIPEAEDDVVYLPIVVHVVHLGSAIGEGANLSEERVIRQIEILNEDFRRKEGTRGYNNHPDSEDAKIEFVLAKQTPDGQPTNGINRIEITQETFADLGFDERAYGKLDYWDSNQYINVWTAPYPEGANCLLLGKATGPLGVDLPGSEHLGAPEPGDPEGIMINWVHFGASNIDCHARYGRTLTHEMGHYLGLLHPWGARDCEFNDYCEDTPAVDNFVYGREPYLGCKGETIMIENYMNWSHDEVMNIFTKDQIARMQYVLKNHPGRNALTKSRGLNGL